MNRVVVRLAMQTTEKNAWLINCSYIAFFKKHGSSLLLIPYWRKGNLYNIFNSHTSFLWCKSRSVIKCNDHQIRGVKDKESSLFENDFYGPELHYHSDTLLRCLKRILALLPRALFHCCTITGFRKSYFASLTHLKYIG